MRKLSALLLVLICTASLSFTVSAKSNSSNLNKERLEVGRALLEVTADQLPEIIPYYTDDIEYHDPAVDIYGIVDMTEFLYRLFGNTPDLITIVEDQIAIDDQYMATWTMVGTYYVTQEDGTQEGIEYEAKGMSIIKFKPKSTDVWYQRDYYSEGDIMAAIPGLDQAIFGFRVFYLCSVDPNYACPL
jgi:hypothetical protein